MTTSIVLEIVQDRKKKRKKNTNWSAVVKKKFGITIVAILAHWGGTEGSEICSSFEHSVMTQVVLDIKGDHTHL